MPGTAFFRYPLQLRNHFCRDFIGIAFNKIGFFSAIAVPEYGVVRLSLSSSPERKMFAVDGGFNRHKLAAGFQRLMASTDSRTTCGMARSTASRYKGADCCRTPGDAGRCRGSPQDDLDGLPDIIQPPDDLPGACRAGCQNTEVVFMEAVCPREVSADIKGV